MRSTWIKDASKVNCFASLILTKSSTPVTRASPAKCPIFPGAIPSSHTSVGPSASSSARWARRALNFPRLAALAGSLSRSKPLRRVGP